MDKLIIKGPCELSGEVTVSKAKNAYLPIICGTLLNEHEVKLKNIPKLRDIRTISNVLENLGVIVSHNEEMTTFNAGDITSLEATYDLVRTMRASILVLGPLLSRFGRAKVSLPGGCAIGARPIDIHLKNLEKMGAKINLDGGYVEATAKKLIGTKLVLSFPSVGATENLMMAAVFAEGETIIENAALEPEVDDLANFLNAMGAKVTGIGTSILKIEGVKELQSVSYEAIGDRIEAATYLMAALATNSSITVKGINPTFLDAVTSILKEMGADISVGDNHIKVEPSKLKATKVETAPFPGFPTDVQAQLMALMTQVEGSSIITEHIFENRFMHVPELKRLGANIELEGKTAIINGKCSLTGAPVMCTDLRASAALIIAACAAKGATEILRIYHLDRGYEDLHLKLKQLGANVSRIRSDS